VLCRIFFFLFAIAFNDGKDIFFLYIQILETVLALLLLPVVGLLFYKAARAWMQHVADLEQYDKNLSQRSKELKLQKDLEVNLLKERAAFTRITYHELRGPLHSISAALELLPELCALPPGVRPSLSAQDIVVYEKRILERTTLVENLAVNLGVCLRILDDVLLVDKVQMGKFQLHVHKNYDVSKAVESCCSSAVYQSSKQGVTLTQNIVPVHCNVDPTRIHQVVSNLLSNALKFSPKNGVVSVDCYKEEEKAIIRVHDQGCGIPGDATLRIFEEHNNVINDGEIHARGTGLGLYIIKTLVTLHGGSIRVDSKSGSTLFVVTLPVAVAEYSDRGNSMDVLRSSTESSTIQESVSGQYILLVDDDRMCRTYTKLLLLSIDSSLKIEEAESGQESIELCGLKNFDIVILDKEMPHMSGIDVLRVLKKSKYPACFVGLTGSAEPESIGLFHAEGADMVLTKPANRASLKRIFTRQNDSRSEII
tara:strand:- start:4616 stop:6055 length:1440 start_codon:yes stop_codon:yes gene_type:complete